jgi:hypothetical protein
VSARCGHPTPDGPCRNQVASAGRCAAGHPTTPRPAATTATGASTAAADPLAPPPSSGGPPPELATVVDAFATRADARHAAQMPKGACGAMSYRFAEACEQAGLPARVAGHQ